MRVMTYNILAAHWTEYMDVQLRYEPFKAVLDTYDPDIAGLQEVCTKWIQLLNNGISDKYGIIHPRTPDNLHPNFSVIIYKKDRFEVEAAGYGMYDGTSHGALANPWCYSWAVLKDKESGARFAFTSTHFVWVSIDNWAMRDRFAHQLSAFLADLEKKYSVPVVAMGDYNAHVKEPAYSTMKSSLLSAREVAIERINMEYKTTNRVGQPPALNESGTDAVDHCFISPEGLIPHRYELIIEPRSYAYSDHVPQRLTFELC